MLSVEFTTQFKKDYKLAVKRGRDPDKLLEVVELLANEVELPTKYRDHALVNSYAFSSPLFGSLGRLANTLKVTRFITHF